MATKLSHSPGNGDGPEILAPFGDGLMDGGPFSTVAQGVTGIFYVAP